MKAYSSRACHDYWAQLPQLPPFWRAEVMLQLYSCRGHCWWELPISYKSEREKENLCCACCVHGGGNPRGLQAKSPCLSCGNQAKHSWTRTPVVPARKERLPVLSI